MKLLGMWMLIIGYVLIAIDSSRIGQINLAIAMACFSAAMWFLFT